MVRAAIHSKSRVSLQRVCDGSTAQPLSIEHTRRLLQDYLSWDIMVNTPESVMEALAIEHRYKISLRDALVIQAAGTAGATIIYSEGLADGQTYGPLRVVKPCRHLKHTNGGETQNWYL